VWNLALEQANWYRPEWGPTPGYVAQSAQLTEARAANGWLAAGSFTVQQQALRDFAQAMKNWWAGTHGRPTWRKKGRHEGFRIVAVKAEHLRRLNRRGAEVFVPKVGWVRFRLTRPLPTEAKSYRVTLDRTGRWHVAFALKPEPIERRPTGAMIGIDRGVTNTLATSDGHLLHAPVLTPTERARLVRLQRRLARRKQGSRRRERARRAVARLRTRDADRAKDWIEKTTTSLVRDYDLVAIEDLRVKAMTRSARGTIEAPGHNVAAKSALNREILGRRWGLFARRLCEKATLAGVVVVKVNPVNTSRRCHACGHVAAENRKNQAVFGCVACGHVANADVNAAMNILAAGRAVTAHGEALVASLNCEPQPAPPTAA
jgi:IS605 OrfB family transposase